MKNNPYIGPRPYERRDRHNFFGRAREARDLLALVKAERAVLFYAQSGAGKTSLLNAQIIPALEEEGFHVLPVARVGSDVPPGIDPKAVPNIFVLSALMGLAGKDTPAEELTHHTLLSFLRKLVPASSDDETRPPILMLDQFEEILTTHRDRWQDAQGFFQQLQEALREIPTLGVVLAMREDHLAEIDPYAALLPKRLRTRFRMELLSREAALEAVKRPAQDAGCPFAPGVAERLVDDLSRIRVQRYSETAETEVIGPFVEPVQLQVVCQRLWENLPDAARMDHTIQWEEVGQFGNIDRALTDFYESALDLAKASEPLQGWSVTERQLRRWFSEQLITPMQTRGLALRGKDETAGLPNAAVNILENRHLIRADVRAGSTWYELAHDRLVEPILKSNRAWAAARQTPLRIAAQHWRESKNQDLLYQDKTLKEGLAWAKSHPADAEPYETEFLEASTQAEQARIGRRRLYVAGAIASAAVLAVMVVLTIFAVRGQSEANAQRQQAVQQRQVAVTAQAWAMAQQATAEAERDRAEAQARIALARQLEAQAQAALDKTGTGLVRSALLAIESLRLHHSPEADQTLRLGLGLLPRPISWIEHKGPVRTLAFSPDQQWIVSASDDDGVQIWEAASGKAVRRLPHSSPVLAVAVSPDGKWVASGSKDGIARVWEAATGQERARTQHKGTVLSLAFSPDGRKVVSGEDCSGAPETCKAVARVWDAATGQEISSLDEHTGGTRVVAFSPDGELVASGDWRGTVWVWETTTGKVRHSLHHDGGIRAAAFSQDGSRILTASWDKTARVWNTDTGEQISEMVHEGPLQAAAFISNGRLVISGGEEGTARVWDAITGREIARTVHDGPVSAVASSPDGKLVASGSSDGTVRVWEANTGREVSRIAHEAAVSSVAFSPDGTRIASASVDQTARVYKLNWMAHDGTVWRVVFSRDGRWIASGGGDGKARVWETATGRLVSEVDHKSNVWALAFSPDGQWVASGAENGSMHVWEVATGKSIPVGSPGYWVAGLAFSPDGKWVASAGGKAARVWQIDTGRQVAHMDHSDGMSAVAFSPDGQRVASASIDKTVKVWDVKTERVITLITHTYRVNTLAFSPDGRLVASGSGDWGIPGELWVWEAATGNKLAQVAYDRAVWAVAFSPDGQRVAAASEDDTARVWDVATGREVARMSHGYWVQTIAYSPDGQWVASGSYDHTLRVWEAATGREVARMKHEHSVHAVAFSPDGRWLASGGEDNVVQVWLWQSKDLIAEACARLPRNLTQEEWRQYLGDESYHPTCPNLPAPKP